MDGKNLKIPNGIMERYFDQDQFGLYIPKPDALDMKGVAERVERQLKADNGLAVSMTGRYTKTDVDFTDNPEGNSPVIGFGVKRFGKRVYTRKKRDFEKMGLASFVQSSTKFKKQLDKRATAIRKYGEEVHELFKSLEPEEEDTKEKLIWQVEMDQSLTGGGFDNNSIGEVHRSGLKFIIDASSDLDIKDSNLSSWVVEASLWLREQLQASGLVLGSLEPDGASTVRFEQDNDGMLGYPVNAPAYSSLTKDIAQRLLMEFGISTGEFVGSTVIDRVSKNTFEYRVLDAVIHIMDRLVVGSDNWYAIVILLARIQKHGWVLDGDNLESKPGKTRSVYPVSAIPAMQEAMTFSPFLKALKEHKVPFMPSLQDKDTRVEMIMKMITYHYPKGYDFLAADWSRYDATVKGSILATIIQLAVKPFYNARWYNWVDLATHTVTNKYILFREDLCEINGDDFAEAKELAPYEIVSAPRIKGTQHNWVIFGTSNGLISGLKFTHGGGSMYGMVTIHYMIPKMLGFEPVVGNQAGDDTLLGVPMERIFVDSSEKTYQPISDAAEQLGLVMNPSKQIWHQALGEVVKVFLQEIYHYQLDIRGVGSIARPLSALPTSEYDKGLSISEQLMAEIARMNGGHDNPFAHMGVRFWLNNEEFLGSLFKEYGVNAFEVIVQSIGESTEEIAKRIDVGSFSWGIGLDELRSGKLPILPLMAEEAKDMTFSESPSSIIKTLGAQEPEMETINDFPIEDEYFDVLGD